MTVRTVGGPGARQAGVGSGDRTDAHPSSPQSAGIVPLQRWPTAQPAIYSPRGQLPHLYQPAVADGVPPRRDRPRLGSLQAQVGALKAALGVHQSTVRRHQEGPLGARAVQHHDGGP